MRVKAPGGVNVLLMTFLMSSPLHMISRFCDVII